MPQSLLEALRSLATKAGYADPALVLGGRARTRKESEIRRWWVD